MSETTAAYQVKAKSGIMNNNTRNEFAAYGLEILKRSVLLVLYEDTDVVYKRLVLIRFIDFCSCEDEVFEFHQRASETVIEKSPEETSSELIAHSGLKSPLRSGPHPRNVELFCELTDRRLNASAHPHVKFAKVLGVVPLLIAAACREQTRVFGCESLCVKVLRNVSFVSKDHRIPAVFRHHAEDFSVVYMCGGDRNINRYPGSRADQMPPKSEERSEVFRRTVSISRKRSRSIRPFQVRP